MTNNTEPICGVCGKLLTMRNNKYHCDSCKNSETNRCEECKSVFTYHPKNDKVAIFFLFKKNRKILDKWCSLCPKCRKADKEFLPYWTFGHQLEHGTTKELIHLALEKNQTIKDDLKHKGIPEELFL